MPLAIAVLVPMIEVGATKLPFEELFAFASKLLIGARAGLTVMLAHRRLAPILALACVLLSGGCATPAGVERADSQSVHRELTGNVLSTGELSDFTQNVLRLGSIAETAEDDPEAALATLHEAVTAGVAGQNAMFAYAELAFKTRFGRWWPPYYLASAVYAFAYLSAGVPPPGRHQANIDQTPLVGSWAPAAARCRGAGCIVRRPYG